jgi:hypothetical protein
VRREEAGERPIMLACQGEDQEKSRKVKRSPEIIVGDAFENFFTFGLSSFLEFSRVFWTFSRLLWTFLDFSGLFRTF